MKKNGVHNLLAYIGLVNWIAVICVMLYTFYVNDPYIRRSVFDVFSIYLKYSFIPAIISIIFTKKVLNSKASLFIFYINIIYLIVYVIGVLFLRNLYMYG